MSSCSRTDVLVFNKKTSSYSTRRHVFSCNKRTCLLNQQGDMSIEFCAGCAKPQPWTATTTATTTGTGTATSKLASEVTNMLTLRGTLLIWTTTKPQSNILYSFSFVDRVVFVVVCLYFRRAVCIASFCSFVCCVLCGCWCVAVLVYCVCCLHVLFVWSLQLFVCRVCICLCLLCVVVVSCLFVGHFSRTMPLYSHGICCSEQILNPSVKY